MIFLHGAGEKGDGSPAALEKLKNHGPTKEIKNGHNMCFTVNGVQECFIVVAPQLPGDKPSWGVAFIDEVFKHALNNYRVDVNKIHLTGLSLGSNGVYKYAYMAVNEPNKLASISPIAAWGDKSKGCIISERKIPVWAFHGDQDKTVGYASGLAMFNSIKDCTSPEPTAELIFTTYEGVAHNSWNRAYNTGHTYHDPNLYEWMLSKTLSGNPTANAGPDQAITLPTNTVVLSGSGSDPDGTISSYAWTQISGPAATLTNQNTATLTASDLVQGIYTFRLTVTDDSGISASDDVAVTVNPEVTNVAPSVNAGPDITITLPINSTNITGTATDSDGSIVSYAWTQRSGPSTAALTGAGTITLTAATLIEGTYKFRLTVQDDDGASSFDEVNVIVNPEAVNNPPVANAGADQTINLPTNSTTIAGSGSDSDGSIAAYLWEQLSGPSATLANTDKPTVTVSGMTEGIYEFRLTVTDDDGATGFDNVIVSVIAVNQNPTANAGSDITLTLPTNSTTLPGTGSDPDGSITTYLWEQISGPSTITITNASNAEATVTSLIEGTYQFQLTVTDDDGAQDADIMRVIVQPAPVNIAPVANAGPDKNITLPVNSVIFNGSGSDADGSIATYLWTKRSGPSTFSLSGQSTATLTASNLVAGTYVFRLTVTDNEGAVHFDEVSVVVAPETVNQAPVANAGADKSITLPANSTTLNGTGTDADGTISSYLWTQLSGPSTATISGSNTNTLNVSDLAEGVYVFELLVTDDKGATDTDNAQVTVSAINVPPVVSAGADVSLVLPANSTDITGTASDNDGTIASTQWVQVAGPAASFTVSGNTLSVTDLIEGNYTFRFSATDDDGATSEDDVEIFVTATNVLPTVSAGPDKSITLPTNTVNLTGTASDSDGTIVTYAWTKVNGPITFTLTNQNTPTLTMSNLVEGTYTMRLTVTDNDGGSKADLAVVTVNPEATNQAPIANAGPNKSITLPTNTVTITGTGSDSDGSIAAYAWTKKTGPAADLSNTGTPTLTVTNMLEGTYVFSLKVTDNKGASHSDDVIVTVNPEIVNQAPVAQAGSDILLILPTNSTNIIGSASDPDGTIVSYVWTQLSGPSTATLAGSGSATLSVSDLVEGAYTFNLTVTDDDGATDEDNVVVTVQSASVNQKPVANAGSDRTIILPTNTINISGSGSDADGAIVSYLWTKVSGPASTLSNTTSATLTASSLVEGTYKFRLMVTDDDGDTATDEMILTVLPETVNQPPSVNSGADITLVLPENATVINGSASDSDGTVVSYIWTKVSGPDATLSGTNQPKLTVTNMVEGSYLFRLSATDDDGAKGSDEVIVAVLPENTNLAPIVNAGADQSIKLPTNTATLNGSASDNDGTIASVIWDKVSGPTVTTSDVNQNSLSLSDLVQGTYIFRFTAMDDDGAENFDEVKVTVFPESFNLDPTANAGPDLLVELPENAVQINGSGSDSDGTIVSYNWFLANGPNNPTLSGQNTATLSVSNLIEGIYVFTLEVVDDGGLTDRDNVKVTVIASEQIEATPPVVYAGEDQTIILPENAAQLIGQMTSEGFAESFAWTQISGGLVQLEGADSDTLNISGLAAGEYTFELMITDNQNLTGTDQVTIYVVSQFPDLEFPMKMFSPNRDGENDTWILDPDLSTYESCQLYIFNRQGSKVYEAFPYMNNWEAQLNGDDLPEGVYYYVIQCDNKNSKSGSITVIR
ncbi:PKD domain containing protein [Fulvivirga imtechensis AK7]|uniref:PKD domain containing protein n=2 Tax=Fulvivirga TaxID=396811 RepID=L8K1M5_9BACT|nr:PKD domain containing protein [Fulvivirga imtechensis AK7]